MNFFNNLKTLLNKEPIFIKKEQVQKPVIEKPVYKESKSTFSGVKQQREETTKEPAKKEYKNKNNRCYGLFASHGNTFLAMHDKDKKTFILDGVNATQRGTPWARESDSMLKTLINKQNIFFEIKGKNDEGFEIIEAYSDYEKTQSINKQLISKQPKDDELNNFQEEILENHNNQQEFKSEFKLQSKIF